ncbi:MAG: cadherin repeat domain-containing protein [Chloroflexota bacterium]
MSILERIPKKSSFTLGLLSLMALLFGVSGSSYASAVNTPTIDVWYGLNQSFGQIGNPQTFVNIFGNVSDPDGLDTNKLTYSLNGGSDQSYNIGPDNRRLALPGDFNIDIPHANLNEGANSLVITAVDINDNSATATVTINFTDQNTWPTNYTADWSSASKIEDVAQVVDGLWNLTANGVRPAVIDYDRIIAVGDITWTDYTAVVPITVHGLDTDPGAYQSPSNFPGIGLIAHWQDHYDQFNDQPNWGWDNIGAFGLYSWPQGTDGQYQLIVHSGRQQDFDPTKPAIQFNQPYWMKMQVETRTGQTSYFRFKMWLQSESEPADWDVEGPGRMGEPGQGSLLLVAHHVDATFGDVVINSGSTTPPIDFDYSIFLPLLNK